MSPQERFKMARGKKKKLKKKQNQKLNSNKLRYVNRLNSICNAEKVLFDALLSSGFKVIRNYPIEVYKNGAFRIVDIFFEAKKLFIEVDGFSHRGKEKEDKIREKEILNKCPDFIFMRFTNKEVLTDLASCVERVWMYEPPFKKSFIKEVIENLPDKIN